MEQILFHKLSLTGELEGLMMDKRTWQGSYALITSNVLQKTFNQLSQSQNGLGLQTFAYFSGIPWEDTPGTVTTPYVSAAILLSILVIIINSKLIQ
ncbi:hypothetical protein [Candidatus Nanopusillus massiliensis]|uniref:hypothetical protein n=1 Tax=Candidatus Nanopusillus massiliensis TaxID=2897163 RepID=UPI001E5B1063|nr:hypothetical protein [Candidatus Nanopusillus massiliensis]